MARTKASVGAKVAAGKSNKARCSPAPPPSTASTSGTSKSSRNYSGGNPVCPRETPKWQKPITNFYVSTPSSGTESSYNDEDPTAGSSKSKPKRNVIQSDDEEDQEPELPKNHALDESIVLEPLNGESSHKIDEYYSSEDKEKGNRNKTDKENIDVNGNRRSGKREIEDVEESEQNSKRVKIS